jgi:hypothetical protein
MVQLRAVTPRRWTTAAALFACFTAAGPAASQSKEDCVSAYEQTQSLRGEGKLRQARERVLACSQDSCPAVVKKDCAQWLPEIEGSIPTVVFEARDPSGADTSDVRVLFDGVPLKDRLDGKAVAVDPGQHTFRYELVGVAGAEPVEEKVTIREGEKNRKLSIAFGGAGGTVSPGGDTNSTRTPDGGGIPVAAWVLGGVGVVGIGMFATFGIMGLNEKSDAEAPVAEGGCAPDCEDGDVSSIRTKLILADISLGVGVVALGVATYLFISSASDSKPSSSARVSVDVGPTKGGAFGAVRGNF